MAKEISIKGLAISLSADRVITLPSGLVRVKSGARSPIPAFVGILAVVSDLFNRASSPAAEADCLEGSTSVDSAQALLAINRAATRVAAVTRVLIEIAGAFNIVSGYVIGVQDLDT